MARRCGHCSGAKIEEELVFELARAFLCAEDFRLHLLQLGRDEALGVGQGLLARVVGGDGGEIGGADLDVVAEDLVVADLERLDAGAFLLAALESGEPFLALDRGGAKFLQRGMVSGADEAAFLEQDGRVVGQRARVEIGQIGQRRDFLAEFAQGRRRDDSRVPRATPGSCSSETRRAMRSRALPLPWTSRATSRSTSRTWRRRSCRMLRSG